MENNREYYRLWLHSHLTIIDRGWTDKIQTECFSSGSLHNRIQTSPKYQYRSGYWTIPTTIINDNESYIPSWFNKKYFRHGTTGIRYWTVTFSYMAKVNQDVAVILPILPLLLEGRLGTNVSQYFCSSYTIGTEGYIVG